jgi:hypothetical protein
MGQERELSETREIEKSLNIAIGVLVFSSLYLGFSVWFMLRSAQEGKWTQEVLGISFLAMAVLSIIRCVWRIKEIVRRLLDHPPATL